MKKSTPSNRKTIRMITKNLIILLVLILVAILAMWAWFTKRTVDTADGLNVKCVIPDGIEIAVVAPDATPTDDDYTNNDKTFITIGEQDFIKDLVLSEVTSDGKTFYKPALIQSNGIAEPDLEAKWDKAVANENYLSFDLYVRSKATQTVSLTTNTKFTTAYPDKMTGEDAYNKSTEGSYSRDCIVGATRFSVVDYNDDKDGEIKLLWIPRPDIYFFNSDTSSGVALDVPETGEGSYDGITYKHKYYEVSSTTKTPKTIDSSSNLDYFKTSGINDDNEYVLPDKTEILDLNTKTGDDLYYTKCVRCNMWVEGEDSEDRLALVKGRFQIYLDLTIK